MYRQFYRVKTHACRYNHDIKRVYVVLEMIVDSYCAVHFSLLPKKLISLCSFSIFGIHPVLIRIPEKAYTHCETGVSLSVNAYTYCATGVSVKNEFA